MVVDAFVETSTDDGATWKRAEDPRPELSWFDQLGTFFPRLALAAALVILISVTADFALSWLGVPTLSDGVW